MYYDVVEITNFRGIKHLAINDLGDFNIFTGRNNTGKSSCLEAIALLSSGNSDFKDVFDQDVLQQITFRRAKSKLSWKYLIHSGAKKSSIFGFKMGENKETEGMLIGKTPSDIELGPDDKLLEKINDQLEQKRQTPYRELVYEPVGGKKYTERARGIPKIQDKMFFYFNNSKECLAELYETNYEKDVVVVSTGKKESHGINKESLFIGNIEQIGGELHDRIAETGKLHEVITRLHEKFSDIKDVRQIGDVLYIFFKQGNKMPLDTMGDGFKVTMLITMASHALQNGVLMIEEPENYLHPGLMFHLIEELFISCKEHKIQIFVSTHSDEFIKYTLENAKDLDVSIIKLNKLDDEVEAEVYKKEHALENIEKLSIDLRGF